MLNENRDESMTIKQRKYLSELRECVNDFTQFVPYVQNQVLKQFMNSIDKVLFGVLADNPNNDYLYEDWETATNELARIKDILSKEHAKC